MELSTKQAQLRRMQEGLKTLATEPTNARPKKKPAPPKLCRTPRRECGNNLREHVNQMIAQVADAYGLWYAELLNGSHKQEPVPQARCEIMRRLRKSVVCWDRYEGPNRIVRRYRVTTVADPLVGTYVNADSGPRYRRMSYPDIAFLLGVHHSTLVLAAKKVREAKAAAASQEGDGDELHGV